MAVTPVAASGAIPLMAADGTTAVNTAEDYRQGFIGALLAPAPGGPMAWRPGVLPTAWVTGSPGAYADLRVTASATADQNIHIGAGRAVVVRSGASAGPYLVRYKAASTILLDANPTTNPRYDVVYIQLTDVAIGDSGTQGAVINVVDGTPNATPAIPAIPTGAIPLATILRPTFASNGNTNNVTTAQIADARKSSGVLHGTRPLLPGDALSDPGSYPGEITSDAVTSVKAGLRIWDGSGWHGIQPINYLGSNSIAPATVIDGGASGPFSDITPYTLAIPDPGWPYVLEVSGKYGGSGLSQNMHYQILVNGNPVSSDYCIPAGTFQANFPATIYPTVLTGASTVKLVSRFDYASTSFTTSATPTATYLYVRVLPA